METASPTDKREFLIKNIECDLVVIGGGLAGVCCAITAARAGIRVTLIQDRPVLGGNASSEIRLWALGATSHMNSNNRWAREGGVIDEIMVENLARNPEGNAVILDTVMLGKVVQEPNITLLLNTVVIEVQKLDTDTIAGVTAFCSQNATRYEVSAPLFCDASGDGVVGFLSGAAFRMGAETSTEFGEKFAPSQEYGELLGHTIYFYSKDVGQPVQFIPPSYAHKKIPDLIPRYRNFNPKEFGAKLWWVEYGGRLDTVHDTEAIKWELWKVIYGVWDYIKNSGEFPDAETLTLEWVGLIPGKRESRRFEGDYMLIQQDIVEQRHHHDAVSFGGWSIDLHPADGVFSEKPGCDQWHSKGVYQIPYRCMYSRNIKNLFLAGRIISASHVAFGSSRVMATCANSAQAVGMAAALCHQQGKLPSHWSQPGNIETLQRELLRRGQYIPGFHLDDPDDLVRRATIEASSQLRLSQLPPNGPVVSLTQSWAQMLPVVAGAVPQVTFTLDVTQETTLQLQLRTSSRVENHTPDVILATKEIDLEAGEDQKIQAHFDFSIDELRYVFYCLMVNPAISVHTTLQRVTGILSVYHSHNQQPEHDIGVDAYEFWRPQRRPLGHNLAVEIDPPLDVFLPQNIANGLARPTSQPNGWVADFRDKASTLTLRWAQPQKISKIDLSCDTDFDHPMESVLMEHPERYMPFCVKHYRILDQDRKVVFEESDNHQTLNSLVFDEPLVTNQLTLECVEMHGDVPATVFEMRCY
jgi:hypothetical protein